MQAPELGQMRDNVRQSRPDDPAVEVRRKRAVITGSNDIRVDGARVPALQAMPATHRI